MEQYKETRMTVRLAIDKIEIEPASNNVAPTMNRANVTVRVYWNNNSTLELVLYEADYTDLVAVVESARSQISGFASELLEAASKPLEGSIKSP